VKSHYRLLPDATLVITIFLLLLIPLLKSPYATTWFMTLFLYITLAQSWNLMAGFAGQFSLGHSAFVGIGGAASALLLLYLGTAPYTSVLVGGVTALALAAAVSVPFFQLKGPYFAFSTLGLAEILKVILSAQSELGGTGGISLPLRIDANLSYYVQMILALVTTVTVYKIAGSKFGVGLIAIREDEDVAEALGIPVLKFKIMAFMLSCFLAGLAGSIFSLSLSYYNVISFFDLSWSLRTVLMVMIGGLGTVGGPIIGAIILVFLYNWLLVLPYWNLVIMGVILIVVAVIAPKGVIGELLKIPILRSAMRKIEKKI